jgi:hypothetical protein
MVKDSPNVGRDERVEVTSTDRRLHQGRRHRGHSRGGTGRGDNRRRAEEGEQSPWGADHKAWLPHTGPAGEDSPVCRGHRNGLVAAGEGSPPWDGGAGTCSGHDRRSSHGEGSYRGSRHGSRRGEDCILEEVQDRGDPSRSWEGGRAYVHPANGSGHADRAWARPAESGRVSAH